MLKAEEGAAVAARQAARGDGSPSKSVKSTKSAASGHAVEAGAGVEGGTEEEEEDEEGDADGPAGGAGLGYLSAHVHTYVLPVGGRAGR